MFFSHKEVPYYAGNPHPLQFNSVEFRDGQQSLFATRMTTDEMIPLLEEMDEVGFATMEMWGGATLTSVSVTSRRSLGATPHL